MILKNISRFFLALIAVTLLVPFQNCGKVPIKALSIAVDPVPVAKTNITAQSCVKAKSLLPEKTKYIFVIDLSRSNLGEFYKSDFLFNGQLTTGKRYSFFSSDLGTDPTGTRFDALKNFITTCGGEDSDTEYSVIGFSDTAGSIETSGSSKILKCEQTQFYKNTEALQKIDEMKSLANSEKAVYEKFKEPTTPYSSGPVAALLSKQTNYVDAASCISKTLENDLMTPNSAIHYQIFFVSDGAALADSTGCEKPEVTDKIKCYTDKMDASLSYSMKLSSALSKDVRIHSVYYSKSGAQDTNIENYMKYLSVLGQTRDPINLGNISASASSGTNPFCQLLSVNRSIVYKTNSIVAININKIQVGDRLLDDSDADGISDIDEINNYHSDPKNPRSMVPGVLDGICKIFGGREACLKAYSKISCDKNLINQFNMSDCDIKILKLDQYAVNPKLAGIDSDNDGIPDYIEIIKGLNPLSADSNLDTDNDGLTNLEEISIGHDPFTPDQNAPATLSFKLAFLDTIEGCDNGGWSYSLNSVASTEGQNQIMMYFKTISQNSINDSEFRTYTLDLNLTKSSALKNQLLSNIENRLIRPSDFVIVEKKVSSP